MTRDKLLRLVCKKVFREKDEIKFKEIDCHICINGSEHTGW